MKKIEVAIYEDERWPDYDLDTSINRCAECVVEVPTELYERYVKIKEEYDQLQDLISDLIPEEED